MTTESMRAAFEASIAKAKLRLRHQEGWSAMKTDREMLELAAKAAGYAVRWLRDIGEETFVPMAKRPGCNVEMIDKAMIDIDKIKRAAEAARDVFEKNYGEARWSNWSHWADIICAKKEDAEFIAACSPQTILKLIAVVRAAKAMIELYDKLALVLPGSEPDALREALGALK